MSRSSVPARVRKLVSQRAEDCCEYCRSDARYSYSPFDVDHIIPLHLGGGSSPENMAWSCHGCNLFKRDRTHAFDTLSEAEASLFNPRTQDWNEHFAWSSDGSLMVGLTMTGRASIDLLRLNRRGLVNQRKILTELGLHPAM
jgi:hypothetical protein